MGCGECALSGGCEALTSQGVTVFPASKALLLYNVRQAVAQLVQDLQCTRHSYDIEGQQKAKSICIHVQMEAFFCVDVAATIVDALGARLWCCRWVDQWRPLRWREGGGERVGPSSPPVARQLCQWLSEKFSLEVIRVLTACNWPLVLEGWPPPFCLLGPRKVT